MHVSSIKEHSKHAIQCRRYEQVRITHYSTEMGLYLKTNHSKISAGHSSKFYQKYFKYIKAYNSGVPRFQSCRNNLI
uniref:Uncharacterized protein n=1 Tax=Anguilla anguilla TaxID=7936 RepID=A0A0E9W0N4_ANGAN